MAPVVFAATENGIDPDALIEQIVAIDTEQHQMLKDVVFDVELAEGKMGDDGQLQVEATFDKKISILYESDTAFFAEDYLAYYKDGETQSDKALKDAAKERVEKKRKRKTRDVSFPMLDPFYPEFRQLYEITYVGVASEPINGYVCHHFKVRSLEPDKNRMNGDFYFEAESFHLVRCDFSPSKLTKGMMFRMNQLDMSISFAPVADGYWLPTFFQIQGKGKAALFIGVNFAATERYYNPVINGGLDKSIFGQDE